MNLLRDPVMILLNAREKMFWETLRTYRNEAGHTKTLFRCQYYF